VNTFQQAFLAHLALYEIAAGVLVVAAVAFLLFLLSRYTVTKYTIRNPGGPGDR
jgi:hypothetical protein